MIPTTVNQKLKEEEEEEKEETGVHWDHFANTVCPYQLPK